ncbi:MAG TPA: hypothetical protein VEH29_00160, partial [Acidimicrobiales bacterium]|nr:hypothetical protein [Acidimicrobiales bacterium]
MSGRRYARRRAGAGALALALIAAIVIGTGTLISSHRGKPGAYSGKAVRPSGGPGSKAGTTSSSTTTTTTSPFRHVPPGPPADERHLVLIDTIGGHISPKSVDASDTGMVFAQNMMYTHTITVYASSGRLLKTISDGVD